MSDFNGMPAFGVGGLAMRHPLETSKQAVPEVAKTATDGSATNKRGDTSSDQNGAYSQSKRDSVVSEQQRKDAVRDETVLTGPTPAFQASILEVEKDLRNVIARVEAKRTQQSDEAAIAPRAAQGDAQAAQKTDRPEASHDGAAKGVADVSTAGSVDRGEAPEQVRDAPAPQTVPAPSQSGDPEAAHSGPAATQSTPYSPPS